MAIGSTSIADKVLGYFPEINLNILKPLIKGEKIKKKYHQTQVWADYFFIAACYAYSVGDKDKGLNLVNQIKESFSDYDPLPRFSWGYLFRPGKGDELDDNSFQERYILMRKFVNNNSCFNFEEFFSEHFPIDLERLFQFY